MTDISKLLNKCLFFTANKLTRVITKMAEEEFMATGLSPTYAFLVHIVNEKEGLSQKDIGDLLHIKASTVTRFVDKLESKALVVRKSDGKKVRLYSTDQGKSIQMEIDLAWKRLYDRYSTILGYGEGDALTGQLDHVGKMLEEEVL